MTRLRALGAVLVVLVVLVVGGAATTVQYNQLNGPEQAVLDYAALLADGRATEAGRRVPPSADQAKYRLDLSLLTDDVMAEASDRILPLSASIENGRPGGDGVAIGSTVTVDLTYGLGRQSAVASLQVKRVADGFPFAHRWQVTTPLLVPVLVRSNLPSLGAPSVAGHELPMVGSTVQDRVAAPQPVMLYPGIYPLTTPQLALLTTDTDVKGTKAAVDAIQPSNALVNDTVTTTLTWSPSRDMLSQLTSWVISRLTDCVAKGPEMPAGQCPAGLYALRSKRGLINPGAPSQPVLGSPVLGSEGTVSVSFGFNSPAAVTWTGGPAAGVRVPVSGVVAFAPTDTQIGEPVLSTS